MVGRLAVLQTAGAFLAALILTAFGPAATLAQFQCEPGSPVEQLQAATAVVDATVLEIIPEETQAQVRLIIHRVYKDDTGLLADGGGLALTTSLPGDMVVGEVPFNDGWPHWRLYLHPLEPGCTALVTDLCRGSAPIPAP